MTASSYNHARLTVMAALAFALLASLLGLAFRVWPGQTAGSEIWLMAACAALSLVLLGILLTQPFARIGWVTAAVGIGFLLYLAVGAVMAELNDGRISSIMPYLLWFFPLLAFNRFVISSRLNPIVTRASIVAPVVLAGSKFIADLIAGQLQPTLAIYCLAFVTFALMLSMFARYREALITEQERSQGLERAEGVARGNEERFRIIAKATADTVWDWDLVKDTIWWSEGLRTLYGYEPVDGETEHGSWRSRLHPEDRLRVLNGIEDAIAGTVEIWTAEYRFLRADGSYADVSDRGFIIRDAGGKGTRMVGGITDVSERKHLEAQLRHSKRLEAVGELTGGIAHDFNNLLTVILGNTEMLSESLAHDAELGPLASGAHDAAGRGAELTKRLLAFARQQALEPKSLDVAAIIAGMKALLRHTLRDDTEMIFVPATTLWRAFADAGQLENAILNLAINARDAMTAGGKLTIEASNATFDDGFLLIDEDVLPGDYVMIAVSDTGSGMSPEVLARAFEPFFTTKGMGSGSGLGLSMVYGYVRQSNGYVKIYSEVGHGTTVRLYLPRASADAQADEPRAIAGRGQGGHERILVVEDDRMVQQYVAASLRSLGYTVTCVDNGVAAEAKLQSPEPYDLLFTDMVMPGGINGKQLAERANALRPQLPVLFTSGYTEDAIMHHGRLDRGVHLLNKPYSRAELAGKVRQALGDGGPGLRS